MPKRSIKTNNEQFSAYLAIPDKPLGPGILMIQEIFGVNQDMQSHCDEMARQGYFALCPDLYWRQQRDVQLTDQSGAQWKQAAQLYQGLDVEKAVDDLLTSMNYLRHIDGCSGKVGSVGFCLGGLLAYLMATRSDADCNVGYYGVGIDLRLNEAGKIEKPSMLHIAGEDQFVDQKAQEKMVAALADNEFVTLHQYPGMNHAFARHGGYHYDSASAQLAEQRTADFLMSHLR